VDEEAFVFGSFRLIPSRRELLEDGNPLRLGSRALDILVTLVRSAGETVHKDRLIACAWPDVVVDEGALRVHVAALRKALGDGHDGKHYIANIAGCGYSFVAPVSRQQRQEPAAPPPNRPGLGNSFPASLTRVIGRAEIISTVVERAAQRRFLTIVGPGGIGKTTVAVAAAEALRIAYADGVWFVGLAALQDPALVPGAVIAAVGGTPGIGDPLASLVQWSRHKRALMILDNCEHVINVAAATAEAILKEAPQVAILATSREPLRAEGEWLLRLPSLDVPPAGILLTAAELLSFPAVELFSERAAAALGETGLADADVPAALEICRRLDGVPLAIELAAAQVDMFGVRGLAARLDDRLNVLTRGRRTALPRQQTLRATIDWSYELLPEAEQRLLRRLAVFPTDFTLDAAAAVVKGGDDPLGAVGESVANLAAKSLVNRDGSAPSGRWRLLDTIRAYALEKLAESGELDAASRQHAGFFRDLIVLAGANEVLRLSIDDVARFGREIDNVRSALDWSFSPDGDTAIGVFLTAAFAPVWLHLSLVVECRERAERAVAVLGPGFNLGALLEGRLHIALAVALILTAGSVDRTRAVVAKARELAESVDDVEAQVRMLWAQWSVEFTTGECRAAQATVRRFSEIARRAGDEGLVRVADRLIANMLHIAGQPGEARKLLERALERHVPPKTQYHRVLFQYDQHALARAMLARVLCVQGFVDQAEEQAWMSFEEAGASDDGLSCCWALQYAVCPIALMTGETTVADRAVTNMNDLAARLDSTLWKILGSLWQGKLFVERREFARGSVLLQNTLDTCDRTGWRICNAEFLGVLAQGLAGLGQLDKALVAADRALARAEQSGERYSVPELLRIKGELLLQQEATNVPWSAAEDCLLDAVAAARGQDALFWELQAALTLARLWMSRNRPGDAKQILAPVYDRFIEGFEVVAVKRARSLLEQLSSAD
jgi:predicted ATPase/DNA-binding winged helix-turn-helix (wHTH) protein